MPILMNNFYEHFISTSNFISTNNSTILFNWSNWNSWWRFSYWHFSHRQQNRYVRLAIYTDPLTLISKKKFKYLKNPGENLHEKRGFRFLPVKCHLYIWVNKFSRFYRELYDIFNGASQCQNFQKFLDMFPVLISKYNFWELVIEKIVQFCCNIQFDVLHVWSFTFLT